MTRWYRGDCHVHSILSSGGELTPPELLAEASGLDFLVITEHNRESDPAAWAFADRLVIFGQEHTTPDGHWLSIGGLKVAAHPFAPYPGGRYAYPLDDVDLFEVWNGAWSSDVWWQADNEAALAAWAADPLARPAIGSSDAHLAGQLGTPHMVVRAASPTAPAIVAALRAGDSWIAASTEVDLSLTTDQDQDPVSVRLEVSGVPGGEMTLHNADGVFHRGAPGVFEGAVRGPFVRAEVRCPDGRMAALTNPIRLR